MTANNDDFYLSKSEPNKSCLLALKTIILNQGEEVSETKKYGMPCFCYRNKMFCYLWVDKKTDEPYILFVEGNHLEHPLLEGGSRSRMKILRIEAADDLPLELINELLALALGLYRSGKIKTK